MKIETVIRPHERADIRHMERLVAARKRQIGMAAGSKGP
jgi:hypothetical protein